MNRDNVVEFLDHAPAPAPAAEGNTETDNDKLHAEAFRDLEGKVCDLERMGQS
jgi:hypothetical protein